MLILPLNMVAGERAMTFADMFGAARLSQMTLSPDGQTMVFVVQQADIENNRMQSDLYMVDLAGTNLRRLTNSEGNNFQPAFRDARRLTFISTREGDAQLYQLELSNPVQVNRLTSVPGGLGTYTWMADGSRIAFQKDVFADAASLAESVAREKEAEESKVSARVLTGLLYRVWNHWKEGKRSHVFLHQPGSDEYRDLTPGDFDTPPVDLGGRRDFAFSPCGRYFAFVKNTDEMVAISTNNDVFLRDLQTGEEKNLTVDNQANDADPFFSPKGTYLAYLAMARPGFEADKRDLIMINIRDNSRRNLTAEFPYSISEYVFSPDERSVFFIVYEGVYKPVYRLDTRRGTITKLVDRVFASGLQVAGGGRQLVFFNQNARRPNEIYRYELRSQKLLAVTDINGEHFRDVVMNPIETFRFAGARGNQVEGILLKPPFFDPEKKYPVVYLVHGGPQGSWGDDFHFRWNLNMFAAPGYVVAAVNFHGSTGYGQDFTNAVSRNWGGAPFTDLVKGQQYLVESYSFIDPNGFVAAGASYGGFMINWMAGHMDSFAYPFRALVSHASIFDARSMYYSTEELWFEEWEYGGTPWDSELYEKWNPANHVTRFSVPMLVSHGERDYRVPVCQGLMLFTALQRRGVPSKMLYFPDEDHFVAKPHNARFWWQEVHAWFDRYLNRD